MSLGRIISMGAQLLFEYTCPECGSGTVRTTRVQNYKTKIKGYPFIVDEGFIGICDHCKAEHFTPKETKRWENLFYRSLKKTSGFFLFRRKTEIEWIKNLRNQRIASGTSF